MEESIVSGPFIVLDHSNYMECNDLSNSVGQGKQLIQAPQQGQPLTVPRGDGLPYPATPADTLITWKCVDGILLCLQSPSGDLPNASTGTFSVNNEQHLLDNPSSFNRLQQPPAANASQSGGSSSHGNRSPYKEETAIFSLDKALPGPRCELVTSTTTALTAVASTKHDPAPTNSSSRSGMVLRRACNTEAIVVTSDLDLDDTTPDGDYGAKGAVFAPGPSTIPGLSSCSLDVRLACRDALLPPRPVRRKVVPARGGLSCPVCGRRCASVLKMKKHVALCRGGGRRESCSKLPSDELAEKHACDLCDAEFPRPLLLRDHMSYIHNLERPFSCMHCPKKFYRSHDFKIHLNIHYNIKNYVCDVCGRQFNHLSNLKRHQRLHTGVCPYVCEICKQRFSQIVGLRQHVALHENKFRTSINTKRQKRKSYCQACGKTFDRKLDRDLHEKREHSHGTFECKSCMNSFSTLELLKNHSCSRHLLKKRRRIAIKTRRQDESFSHCVNNKNQTLKINADGQNILSETLETGNRNNEAMAKKVSKVVDSKLIVKSGNILEPLPRVTTQDSDTLVMYLTQGGDSMAYVLEKRQEAVKASVVLVTGQTPAVTSYRSSDETILINVDEQHLAAGGGRSPSNGALPVHFAMASQADAPAAEESTDHSAVPARSQDGVEVVIAGSDVEAITIKEENIELEYGSDGEAIHNPDQISFSNDVCIHTIVSDITHAMEDHHSDSVSSEIYVSHEPTTTASTAEGMRPTTPASTAIRKRPTTPSSTAVGRRPTTPASTAVGKRPTTPASTAVRRRRWMSTSSYSNSTVKFQPVSTKTNNSPDNVSQVKKARVLLTSQPRIKHLIRGGTEAKKLSKKKIMLPKIAIHDVNAGRKLEKDCKPLLNNMNKTVEDERSEAEENVFLSAEESPGAFPKKVFRCPECGKTFNRRWNYEQHYSLHFPALNRYQCGLCSKSFAYRTTYTAHCASSHGDRAVQYPCSQCNKVLGSSGALRAHERRIHQKLKPHACQLCPRTFHVKSELTYHLRLHRREQPYVCYACGRTFSHSSHVHRHERQHTGERPHRCQLCPQTFIQAVGLTTHMKKHHRQQPPSKQHLRPKSQPEASSLNSYPTGTTQAGLTESSTTVSSPNCTIASVVGQSGRDALSVVYSPVVRGIVMPIQNPEDALSMDHIYQETGLHVPPPASCAGATTAQRLPPQTVTSSSNSSLDSCLMLFGRHATSPDVTSPGRATTLSDTADALASIGENSTAEVGQGRGTAVAVFSGEDSVPVISITETSAPVSHQDSALFMPPLAGPSGGLGAPSDGEALSNLMNVNNVYNIILWKN